MGWSKLCMACLHTSASHQQAINYWIPNVCCIEFLYSFYNEKAMPIKIVQRKSQQNLYIIHRYQGFYATCLCQFLRVNHLSVLCHILAYLYEMTSKYQIKTHSCRHQPYPLTHSQHRFPYGYGMVWVIKHPLQLSLLKHGVVMSSVAV